MRGFTTSALLAVAIGATGCLTPFHVSVGDIDNTHQDTMRHFSVEIVAGGLDENAFVGYFSDSLDSLLYAFSQGPRTGRPLRKSSIGGSLVEEIYKKCPSGRVTGLMTVRESKSFYFYRTETVRVSGYCILEDS